MTLEQWFAADTPDPLLAFVRTRVPPSAFQPPRLPPGYGRRLTLFGCACARTVWDLLPTDLRSAVLVRERHADGRATDADLRASAVRTVVGAVTPGQHAASAAGVEPDWAARSAAKALATRAAGPAPPGRPTTAAWEAAWNAAFAAARLTQAGIARDIFPPPGYTPALRPDWLTPTVVALARQMDASGDFSAAPILADALQDAGCDDETVLQCCRVPGDVHVRGNWVADAVLGRA
jgi:hypothetical protein